MYPDCRDNAPYGLTSWEERFELNGAYGPDWARKQELYLARAQAKFGPLPRAGATVTHMQSDISAPVEDSLRDPDEGFADKDSKKEDPLPVLQPTRRTFNFGYGLAVVQGKVPAPKPFPEAPVGSSGVKDPSSSLPAHDKSTPQCVTTTAVSSGMVKDSAKAAASIAVPAVEALEQHGQAYSTGLVQSNTAVQSCSAEQKYIVCEKATCKVQDDILSDAAMGKAGVRNFKPSKDANTDGSSIAANAKGACSIIKQHSAAHTEPSNHAKLAKGSRRGATEARLHRVLGRWGSADSVQQRHYHGPCRVAAQQLAVGKGTPTHAQHARNAQRQHDARAEAWRQGRARQLFEQRQKQERQEQEKLKREEEVSRAKAARLAEVKRATEKRLAALNALPKAERDRRNAQLKASRDFSDGPEDITARPPSGHSLQRATGVQARPAFKPSGSYSSLIRINQASQAGSLAAKVPAKAAHVSGQFSSKAKAAGKGIAYVNAAGVANDPQKTKPATQFGKGKARDTAKKQQKAETDRQASVEKANGKAQAEAQAAARAAEIQEAKDEAIWWEQEMATRRRNEQAATAARLQRELVRQEAQQRKDQAAAAAAARAIAEAEAAEEERAAAAAQAFAQAEEDKTLQQKIDGMDVDEAPAKCVLRADNPRKASQPAGHAAAQEVHQLYAYWQNEEVMTDIPNHSSSAGADSHFGIDSNSMANAHSLLAPHTLPTDMTAKVTCNAVSDKLGHGSNLSAATSSLATLNTTASDSKAAETSNTNSIPKLTQASNSSAAAGGLPKAHATNITATAPSDDVRSKLAPASKLTTATTNQPSTRNLLTKTIAAAGLSTIAKNKLVSTSSLNATAGSPPVSLTLPTDSMAANATTGGVRSKPEIKLCKTGSSNRSKLGKKRRLEDDHVVADSKQDEDDVPAEAPATKRIKAVICRDANGVPHRFEKGATQAHVVTALKSAPSSKIAPPGQRLAPWR